MTRLTDAADVRPHVVYRLLDASDNLLYVGVSSDFGMRLTHHRSPFINPWAHLVDHWTTEEFADRATARQAERELIAELSPRFNRNHKRRAPLDVTPRGRDNSPIAPLPVEMRELDEFMRAAGVYPYHQTPAESENPRSDSAA